MILPDLIYLATLFTHSEHYMQEARFILVTRVAAKMMGEGKYVFSPITHTYPIAEMGKLPGGWEYWEGYDRCMIAACDKLMVLRLPGWETSTGVQAEIRIAQDHGIPVEYIDYDLIPTIEEVVAMAKSREVLKNDASQHQTSVSVAYDHQGTPVGSANDGRTT